MNKSLKTIQILSKIGRILSKIVFVVCIVGAALCLTGLICVGVGTTDLIEIRGVTIHSILSEVPEISLGTTYAALAVGLTICLGEIFKAKFAERYFTNELQDGTPFTERGAKEMLRLGIISISISLGTSILSNISHDVISHSFTNVEELEISSFTGIGLGVAFLIFSVVFRYGASLKEKEE